MNERLLEFILSNSVLIKERMFGIIFEDIYAFQLIAKWVGTFLSTDLEGEN